MSEPKICSYIAQLYTFLNKGGGGGGAYCIPLPGSAIKGCHLALTFTLYYVLEGYTIILTVLIFILQSCFVNISL